MFRFIRRWRPSLLYVFLSVGCTIVAGSAFCWIAAGELVSPERKELEAWHREWLEAPENYGVKIATSFQLGGRVPCLVVSPDAQAGLAKRGRRVQQVRAQLPKYGEVLAYIVLLRGRNGRKEDLLPVAERFCAAGFLCVLPDLPAHGESPLRTVGYGAGDFESCMAGRLLDEIERLQQLPRRSRFLWGMSMGGAFAVSNASNDQRWCGLVVVSSFDAIEPVMHDQLDWLAPADGLAGGVIGRFAVKRGGVDPTNVRPAIWASDVTCLVMVVHGDSDQLIACASGRRLLESFASPDKTWHAVEGGNHANVLVTAAPTYAAMVDWLLPRVAVASD